MTIVDLAVYSDGKRSDDVSLDDAFEACRAPGTLVWIGLHEPTPEEFDAVRREFALHELAVEDAMKGHQRPKLEVYDDDQLFVVLKTARYFEPDMLEFGEILIFVGDQYVVTVRHGEATPLHDVRLNLEKRPDMLRCGTAAVLHAVMDKVVDDYTPVLTNLDVDITELEAQAFGGDPPMGLTERIYRLKRQVIALHRATGPLHEPLARLADGRYGVNDELKPYFRDVYDHLVRAVQTSDQYRELLTSILEANLTQVSVRQNEQMRAISAWAAILAVPTLIAGIYGMNFQNMPELTWHYGYPLSIALMVAIAGGLYGYFRHIDWL
ncbi:MAG TPA: magnesium/cobalt transporter CorA [Thermoleophilaceae bacterium]